MGERVERGSGVPVKYDAKPGRERYSAAEADWAQVLLKESARAAIRKGT